MAWQNRAREVVKALGITLSPEQEAVLFDPSRILVVGGGEGAGKSFLGALRAVARGLAEAYEWGFPRQLYWIVGADYEDARKEADYIIDFAKALGIFNRSKSSVPVHRDHKVIISLNINVTMETISGYDPTKLGREEPVAIIGCEAGRWEKEVWDRCYGRLARLYPKSWGYFSGTPNSSFDWYADLLRLGMAPNQLDIKTMQLPSWANLSRYPGGREDPAIKQLEMSMSKERFLERHAGIPAPPSDLVVPEFHPTIHISHEAEFDERLPVHVAVDPGTLVYCVLYIQADDEGRVRVVDEIYEHNATSDRVIQQAMLRPAWRNVQSLIMDVAGKQRHMGLDSAHTAWQRATGLPVRGQYVRVRDLVDRLRSILAIDPVSLRPYLVVHPRCKGLIAELGGGPSPVPGGGPWRVRGGEPEHRNDHACKALGYALVQLFGFSKPRPTSVEDVQPLKYVSPATWGRMVRLA